MNVVLKIKRQTHKKNSTLGSTEDSLLNRYVHIYQIKLQNSLKNSFLRDPGLQIFYHKCYST